MGSNADVGNLYNVKTDMIIGNRQFLNDSHLRSNGAFTVERKGKANCQIGNIDMENRFEQLDIDVPQKVDRFVYFKNNLLDQYFGPDVGSEWMRTFCSARGYFGY